LSGHCQSAAFPPSPGAAGAETARPNRAVPVGKGSLEIKKVVGNRMRYSTTRNDDEMGFYGDSWGFK